MRSRKIEINKIKSLCIVILSVIVIITFLTLNHKTSTQPSLHFKETILFEYGDAMSQEELIKVIVDKENSIFDSIIKIDGLDLMKITVTNNDDLIDECNGRTASIIASLGDVEKSFEFKYDVQDTIAPTLSNVNDIEIFEGEELEIQELFIASDPVDGNLVVRIDGYVDWTFPNEYRLIAYAEDRNGNKTESTFKVVVKEKQKTMPESIADKQVNEESQSLIEKKESQGTPNIEKELVNQPDLVCDAKSSNSNKLFDTELEAIEWATDYALENITTIGGFICWSTCDKFTIYFKYYE